MYTLAVGVSIGYIIIITGMFFGMYKGQEVPPVMDIFYMIVGAVNYLIIGIMGFFALGVLTISLILDIVVGILFILDAVLNSSGKL